MQFRIFADFIFFQVYFLLLNFVFVKPEKQFEKETFCGWWIIPAADLKSSSVIRNLTFWLGVINCVGGAVNESHPPCKSKAAFSSSVI